MVAQPLLALLLVLVLASGFTSCLNAGYERLTWKFVDGIKPTGESGHHYYDKQHSKKWLGNYLEAFQSNNYELHVVADGLEVRLCEELMWAIHVA